MCHYLKIDLIDHVITCKYTWSLMSLPANRRDHLCHYLQIDLIAYVCLFVCLIEFDATFNNSSVISRRSVLLVEETGRPGENHWSVASHLSHHALLSLHANKLDCLCLHLKIDLSTCVISTWFSCHIVAHMYIIGVLSFRRILDDESAFGFHWGSSGHSGMGSLFAVFCQDKRMI